MTERQMCLRVDVQRALARLSQKQRRAVLVMGVLGFTGTEYGRINGTKERAAQEILQRGYAVLRHFLCPYKGGTR